VGWQTPKSIPELEEVIEKYAVAPFPIFRADEMGTSYGNVIRKFCSVRGNGKWVLTSERGAAM
jgi:hypothetical protein